MRALALITLVLCAACGTSPTEECPPSEDLLTWVWPVGSARLSQCNRVAELVSPANASVHLRGVRRMAPAQPVALSAKVEVLSGAGTFALFAGESSGPTLESRATGPRSASGIADPSGAAELYIHGLADPAAPMRWRVSDVQVE